MHYLVTTESPARDSDAMTKSNKGNRIVPLNFRKRKKRWKAWWGDTWNQKKTLEEEMVVVVRGGGTQ